MKEDFLHYIWKNGFFKQQQLFTTDAEAIEIKYPGFHNMDAGPDFFNARIRIGDFLWAGNVEIHLKLAIGTSTNINSTKITTLSFCMLFTTMTNRYIEVPVN